MTVISIPFRTSSVPFTTADRLAQLAGSIPVEAHERVICFDEEGQLLVTYFTPAQSFD